MFFATLFVTKTATICLVEFSAHLFLQLRIVLLLEQLGVLYEPRLHSLHARLHPHLNNKTYKFLSSPWQ